MAANRGFPAPQQEFATAAIDRPSQPPKTPTFNARVKIGRPSSPHVHHAPRAGATAISFPFWRRLERFPLKVAAIRERPKRSSGAIFFFIQAVVDLEVLLLNGFAKCEIFISNFHLGRMVDASSKYGVSLGPCREP